MLLLTALALWGSAMAAPAKFVPAARVQPNGDTLHCYASGDEFYNWLHDAEGYTIVQDPATGFYVYAGREQDCTGGTPVYGGLYATTLKPGKDNPKAAGLQSWLMPDKDYLRSAHDAWREPKVNLSESPKSRIRNHGALNNVVIFIRFADETTCTTTPFSTIDSMFNDSTATGVSMYNYFKHTSYGNLRVLTHYRPAPSGTMVMSYQDGYARNYYKPYNAVTNPDGYADEAQRRLREFTLLENAIEWVNLNCPVDTTLNLDIDNDGMVDNVCFVVSGSYTGWSNLLWPHKWSLHDRTVNLGNKRVYTYNLQLAGSGSNYFNVSTFCHEMTHTLGAPDIYHYDNYTSVSPGGSWDLMCSNMSPPQQTNSLFKYHYLNWFDSIPQISDSGTYTLQSLGSGPNNAVKISSAVPHEWYILEYRNNTDTFDASLPNRGMLIWRYNDRREADNATFDFYLAPHQLWLFRPNSSIDTVNGNYSQAAFGVSGRTTFNASSNPHPYLCDGTPDSSFSITDIHLSGPNNSSVTFTYTPHSSGACAPVQNFPLVQDFELADEGCWTMESIDNRNDDKLGAIGTADGNTPYQGSYQFRFSSYHRSTDYNQYLVSPQLMSSSPLRLRFHYRRSNSREELFRVLYSTSSNSSVDFTDTVADVTVNSAGWHECDVTVPAAARYVAINYYSEYQYYLFVDNIELRDTISNDTVIRDTVYVTVHDTVDRLHHDTVTTMIHDTLWTHHTDTLYTVVSDTLVYRPVDTVYTRIVDTIVHTPSRFRLEVTSASPGQGTASGSGVFVENTEVEIAAIARPGYTFAMWTDGNRDNPRTVTVSGDVSYTALFEPQGGQSSAKLVTYIHDTIVLYDTVWRDIHDTVHLTLHDTVWMALRDTVWLTAHDTVWLASDDHDTCNIIIHEDFPLDTITYYALSVHASDVAMGTAAGNGLFPRGTRVELGAVPYSGYHFVRWSDGAEENPHAVTVTGEETIVAYFAASDTTAVGEPDPDATTRVYALGRTVVTEAPANLAVTIYNTMGQQMLSVPSRQDPALRRLVSQPLTSGVYVVRIGDKPATKVIVK